MLCVCDSVKLASLCHSVVEQELLHLATQASGFLDRLYPDGRLSRVSARTVDADDGDDDDDDDGRRKMMVLFDDITAATTTTATTTTHITTVSTVRVQK